MVTLLLGGCGGGEEPSAGTDTGPPASTGPPISKKQFIARGDALCADVQAELLPITARVEKARALPPDAQMAEVEAIWRRQNEIIRSFRDRFAALPPPRGHRPQVVEFLRTLDEGIDLSEDIVGYVDDGREPPSEVMEKYGEAVYRGNALAQGFGFTVCGRSE